MFLSSVGPVETFPREMVSRRKILSRSRDDLNLDQAYLHQQQEEEEDVWYQKDKLFKVSTETRFMSSEQDTRIISSVEWNTKYVLYGMKWVWMVADHVSSNTYL